MILKTNKIGDEIRFRVWDVDYKKFVDSKRVSTISDYYGKSYEYTIYDLMKGDTESTKFLFGSGIYSNKGVEIFSDYIVICDDDIEKRECLVKKQVNLNDNKFDITFFLETILEKEKIEFKKDSKFKILGCAYKNT